MVWRGDGTRRVAACLLTLFDQVNAHYPGRATGNDGTIGDERHQATHSEHNPDSHGIVRALDITHDPAHGFDSYKFADYLREHWDDRVQYIISNSRIANIDVGAKAWRPYHGSNPHDHHVHISARADDRADDPRPWDLQPFFDGAKSAPPSGGEHPEIKIGSTGPAVTELQRLLGIEQDGEFGPNTDAAVRAYQAAHGLDVDGEVGPLTWAALLGHTQPNNPPLSGGAAIYRKLLTGFQASNLLGVVPPDGAQFGITSGSAEEWAIFATAVCDAESGFNPRSANTSDPGGSYGIFQYAHNQVPGGNAYDIDASVSAFIRDAGASRGGLRSGILGQRFSTIGRHPERTTAKLGAAKTIAAQQKGTAPMPVTPVVDPPKPVAGQPAQPAPPAPPAQSAPAIIGAPSSKLDVGRVLQFVVDHEDDAHKVISTVVGIWDATHPDRKIAQPTASAAPQTSAANKPSILLGIVGAIASAVSAHPKVNLIGMDTGILSGILSLGTSAIGATGGWTLVLNALRAILKV